MNAVASHTQEERTARATLGPGDILDEKYQLDGLLGAGAMGEVWLAHNLLLDLPVAIKIVRANPHDMLARERLLTEARFEANLRHGNIVRVFDVHAGPELSYAVMELLEGCTLAELMDEGPLPATLAVRLLLPLLDALTTVHQAGIVHRDIKPENIFITRVGDRVRPKLLDFGIAHSEATAVRALRGTSKNRVVMGTPGYMSPEQAWGDEGVDQRADLWAVGIVLYEAISGASAFECDDYLGFLRALESQEPAPLSGEDELWAILRRALNKDCNHRWYSSAEFAQALMMWLNARGVSEDLTGECLAPHWAAPNGPIDRAFGRARVHSERGGKPGSHARTRSAAKSGARTAPRQPAPQDNLVMRWLRGSGTRGEGFSRLSIGAGLALGVMLALARGQGQAAHEPHAALSGLSLMASPSATLVPKLIALDDSASAEPTNEVSAHVEPVAGKPNPAAKSVAAHARVGVSKAAAAPRKQPTKQEAPRARAHGWKTGSSYSTNVNALPSNERRGELQREAAQLGLKSPW
jgi:serine/threonine protein kinase